jgi:hypothetical protein
MNDTTKADALMKLAERLRMAPLSGGEYRTAHAELESAIEAAIERARADERERCKQVCEAISDQYREREGLRYPEMRTDAETGAGECAAAIEALGTKEGEHHA